MIETPEVKATLEIRRNADGLVRRHPDLWDWYGDYIWEEGNFSCDCNRADFFAQAGGEDELDDRSCGETAYSVRLTTEAGATLYEDGYGWPSATAAATEAGTQNEKASPAR